MTKKNCFGWSKKIIAMLGSKVINNFSMQIEFHSVKVNNASPPSYLCFDPKVVSTKGKRIRRRGIIFEQ